MGRPKKVPNSKSRSFLLPLVLLNQIERAAKLRDSDVSDVVRDILEENIIDYCEDSQEVSRIHMRQALSAVYADPCVCKIFDQFKDKNQMVVPLHTGLDKRQLLTLIAGLEAYQNLKRHEADPLEKIKSREALDALVKAANDYEGCLRWAETEKHLRRLAVLLDARDDVWIAQEQGETIIEVEEFLARLVEDGRVDLRALRSLQILIRNKVLCSEGGDIGRYKVPPPPPYNSADVDEDYSET
jgi:hypothetical protein